MKFRFSAQWILVALLLMICPDRLPAPISEIQEQASPTPTLTPKSKPKPKSKRSSPSPSQSIAQNAIPHRRFAGTWKGNTQEGPFTIVINDTETEASVMGGWVGTQGGKATVHGKAIAWSGAMLSHW